MALVEFGDQAYVITPFTTDYDNILLSMSLIGDWTEFMTFPDQGTIIANAIDQSVGAVQGVRLPRRRRQPDGDLHRRHRRARSPRTGAAPSTCSRDATNAKIPVYFIRVGIPSRQQPGVSDEAWAAAVARTGGRFYNAADEDGHRSARLQDIDRAAVGQIEMRQYITEQPRFAPFALLRRRAVERGAGAAAHRALVPEVSVTDGGPRSRVDMKSFATLLVTALALAAAGALLWLAGDLERRLAGAEHTPGHAALRAGRSRSCDAAAGARLLDPGARGG